MGVHTKLSKTDTKLLLIDMFPSETDPLLPQNNPAPEISGYGFSKRSKLQRRMRSEVIDQQHVESKGDETDRQQDGSSSALRIIFSIFAIVVGLAILVTLLVPGTWDLPWHAPKDETSTIQARVDKILSKNPLIGR